MYISNKSKETIEACRFCWMCRHICPIGNATAQERNNARARALALSLVERGVLELKEAADNLYECALCGGCTQDCATGWDPVTFVLDVRREAAMNGVLPDGVKKLVESCLKYNNPYGAEKIDGSLKKVCVKGKSKMLLLLGTDTRFRLPKIGVGAVNALKNAGGEFDVLEDEPDTGAKLYFLVGDTDEVRKAVQQFSEKVSSYNKIVCYDPEDAKMLLHTCREWGVKLPETVTYPSELYALYKAGKWKPVKTGKEFTYQDPFQLARDLSQTEPARELLQAAGSLKEFLLNKKATVWAGGILMGEYLPQTMELTAKARLEQCKNVGGKTLVTSSPSEYAVLSAAADGVEVLPLECALGLCK